MRYYGAGFTHCYLAAVDVEKAKAVHALFARINLKFQRLSVFLFRLRSDVSIKHSFFVYRSHVGKICYVFIRFGLNTGHRLCGLVFFSLVYDLLAKLDVHTL